MLLKASLAAAAVSLFVNGASAFSNTSPHLFFANDNAKDLQHDSKYANAGAAERETAAADSFVVQSSDFDKAVLSALEGCPADAYIFVNIPGLHSSDLASANTLRALYEQASAKFSYPYVSSSSSNGDKLLAKTIISKCQAQEVSVNTAELSFQPYVDATPRVLTLDFASLPVEDVDRQQALQNDLEFALSTVAHSLPSPNYVVVLTSSPSETLVSASKVSRKETASKKHNSGSLFDNYKFFGTGIFEGTLVALFLIYVLFTALSWLSDLKVSYKSFEKQPTQSTKAQ